MKSASLSRILSVTFCSLIALGAQAAGPQQPKVVAALSPAAMPEPAATSGLEQQEVRAQLKPHRYTTLAAEIGAKINRIKVREGDAFKAGQTLATFDCSIQQAQLAKAQADLKGRQPATERQ